MLRRNYSVSKASPCGVKMKRYGRGDQIQYGSSVDISFGSKTLL